MPMRVILHSSVVRQSKGEERLLGERVALIMTDQAVEVKYGMSCHCIVAKQIVKCMQYIYLVYAVHFFPPRIRN